MGKETYWQESKMKTTVESTNKLFNIWSCPPILSGHIFGFELLSSQDQQGNNYYFHNILSIYLSKLNWLPRRSITLLRTVMKM